jgi:hypothetical protein
MLTKWLKPKFRFGERSRMAVQMAPLWEMKASFPCWGIRAAKLPFRPIAGQITPRQLGPMTLSPPALASFLIRSSIALPCSPASLPPAEMTTAPPTPAAAHSRTISGTVSIGVAMTARSTGIAASEIDAHAASPCTSECRGLTGRMLPWNPPWIRFLISALPMLSGCSLAPITATERGRKILSRL